MISNSVYLVFASICISLLGFITVDKIKTSKTDLDQLDQSMVALSEPVTYTGFEVIDSSSIGLPYYQLEEFILKCNTIDSVPIIDTSYTFFNKVIIRDSTTYIKVPLHNYFKNKQDTAYLKIINVSRIDI